MNYALLDRWLVKVECEIIVDKITYNWTFAFSVVVTIDWHEVVEIAKAILEGQFGKLGWNILGFELTNTN